MKTKVYHEELMFLLHYWPFGNCVLGGEEPFEQPILSCPSVGRGVCSLTPVLFTNMFTCPLQASEPRWFFHPQSIPTHLFPTSQDEEKEHE